MQPDTCLLTRSNGILHDDEFNRIEYDLPMHVVSALQGNFTDCQFSLEVSANPAFGPFVLDNGGFVAAAEAP